MRATKNVNVETQTQLKINKIATEGKMNMNE